jgi:hypothetical protein
VIPRFLVAFGAAEMVCGLTWSPLLAENRPPIDLPALASYGPLGVLFGVMVYFLVWYGPPAITAYTKALDAATDHLPRVAKALERIADGVNPPRPPDDNHRPLFPRP